MPKPGKPVRVEPGATAKVKDPRGLSLEQMIVDPPYMTIDDLEAAAGSIVLLRQMLLQHPPAEARITPRDLFSLCPRSGDALPMNDID